MNAFCKCTLQNLITEIPHLKSTSIRISLITIAFSMFLSTCIRLSYMLGALFMLHIKLK